MTSPTNNAALTHRSILAQVAQDRIAFPSEWVGEILVLDRTQVLPLPFYDPAVIGVIHHQGQILPLVSLARVLFPSLAAVQERISLIRLHHRVPHLAGVGVGVDRILGAHADHDRITPGFHPPDQPIRPFALEMIPPNLWQPIRWSVPVPLT